MTFAISNSEIYFSNMILHNKFINNIFVNPLILSLFITICIFIIISINTKFKKINKNLTSSLIYSYLFILISILLHHFLIKNSFIQINKDKNIEEFSNITSSIPNENEKIIFGNNENNNDNNNDNNIFDSFNINDNDIESFIEKNTKDINNLLEN